MTDSLSASPTEQAELLSLSTSQDTPVPSEFQDPFTWNEFGIKINGSGERQQVERVRMTF